MNDAHSAVADFVSADRYEDSAGDAFLNQATSRFTPTLTQRGSLVPIRELMYLSQVSADLMPRRPIKIELSPTDEGRFELFAPALRLAGVGDTLNDAARDLTSTIVALWEEIVLADPDTLAPDALALAERLKKAFQAR